VRVWTTPGKKELGKFALDVGVRSLNWYNEYYGIPYPLPKQDMIAVPDFSAGAMENWGLITYRETDLLVSENSSFVAKGRVATVVAHELAHQWFGNLVTMEWWKELWLNEGFATFMETKCVNELFPTWNKWTEFLSVHVFTAFDVDSRRNSHPIEVEINNARQVDELFDRISYDKGASVIQMIEASLGQEGFKQGLRIYLNRFKYSNAKTEDLWEALSEGSGKNVFQIMNTWVKKIGFPVVTVTETEEPGKLKVRQNRFLATGDVTPAEDETIWPIELGIATQSSPNVKFIEFNTREAVIPVDVKSPNEWIKINANQTGLFRVQYSSELLKKLSNNLSALNERDRTGIASDSFAFAYAGSIHVVDYLPLLLKYSDETSQTVWSDILGQVGTIRSLLPSQALNNFVLRVISVIAKSLGWDPKPDESESTSTLRGVILSTLGSCGDESVIKEAKVRFQKFLADPNSLPADLQGAVFFLTVSGGGEEEFNQMIKVYQSATLPAQKVSALRNVGSTRDLNLIKKGMEFLISDQVRAQDKVYLLTSLASTGQGREFVWDYFKQNFKMFQEKFSTSLLNNAIKICSGFNTEEKEKDVKDFFDSHTLPGTERTIAQTIETIHSNTVFTNRNAEEIKKFLQPYE
jgi:aminopeptidase N